MRSVSQPLAIVPTKLKKPMTASAPDAATAVNPWSTACGMKCWPTRPLDVAPQMKNVPARNQQSDVRTARRITPGSPGRVGTIAPSVTPSGRTPTSAGSSRTHRRTGTIRTSARTPRTTAPNRQPTVTANAVNSGKKMSCPVLVLAPRMPVTRPRCLTNQRVATVGPRTLATSPVPSPEASPKSSVSCQISRTRLVAISAMPVTTRLRRTTARTPIRAMSQPLNGPDRPKTTSPAAAANDTDAVDQPGSSVIESRNAPGAERTPAVTSTTTAVTATTTHP